MEPEFSVIIPAYNEEKTIGQCLDAVLAQDFSGRFEVVVINGPSSDATRVIVETKGVKLIQLHQRGISTAWNEGSNTAKGNILVFTEADTVVPKDWLSRIHQAYAEHPRISGTVGIYQFKDRSWILNFIVRNVICTFDIIHYLWKKHFAFRGTNFSVRKRVLREAGGFNCGVLTHGDVELSTRVHKRGSILYLPTLVVSTSNRHLRSPKNIFCFLIRLWRAIYFIEVIKKPEKINNMFDVR
ncbi:glycosyltransferase family 2 protein [bacterium]|nr:MAG: glycosyltransferase family 2 protein [bacterium]